MQDGLTPTASANWATVNPLCLRWSSTYAAKCLIDNLMPM